MPGGFKLDSNYSGKTIGEGELFPCTCLPCVLSVVLFQVLKWLVPFQPLFLIAFLMQSGNRDCSLLFFLESV